MCGPEDDIMRHILIQVSGLLSLVVAVRGGGLDYKQNICSGRNTPLRYLKSQCSEVCSIKCMQCCVDSIIAQRFSVVSDTTELRFSGGPDSGELTPCEGIIWHSQ